MMRGDDSAVADNYPTGAFTRGFGRALAEPTAHGPQADGTHARTAVCTENLNPNVEVMKSAQDSVRTYDAGSLNRTRDRRILVQ
jgi:hypothetical protein